MAEPAGQDLEDDKQVVSSAVEKLMAWFNSHTNNTSYVGPTLMPEAKGDGEEPSP